MLNPTDEEANREIIKTTEEKISFKEGRYWAEMPWIETHLDPKTENVFCQSLPPTICDFL